MEIDGVRFAWVAADHESGFWITVEEVAAGQYARDHGSIEIKSIKRDGGFPEDWVVRRPTENQWKAALAQAPALGLQNFNGGLGEVLDNGWIIGAADAYSESHYQKENPEASTHDARRESTKKNDQPAFQAVAGNPGRPATFHYESTFATRIVILPVPTADSANPSR